MEWRNKWGGVNGRPPELGKHKWVQNSKLNQIGTSYSVSLEYVQGVEHHRSTIHTPLGHRDMSSRRRRI